MKRSSLFGLLMLLAPLALANDFPTSGRVEYVLECMQKHESKYEYLYKCSCALDRIATSLPYEEFVSASTALRDQNLPGERGAVFRDSPTVKQMANKFKGMEADALKACHAKGG